MLILIPTYHRHGRNTVSIKLRNGSKPITGTVRFESDIGVRDRYQTYHRHGNILARYWLRLSVSLISDFKLC